MKAVLYARYSTDKQSESSIEDQLRAAHVRLDREGWTVVATHADEGVSGSTPVAMRKGGRALLADVLAKRFDVLIVESLDRLSRDIGEAEGVIKRIEHRGIRIIGTSDGYDTEAKGRKVMRVARGLVNELYLDDLREKTHRGLEGKFERGLSAGGRSYGYTTEPTLYGKRMVIHQDEAPIVREIFQKFADGHSGRSIIHALNKRGVPSARGGTWTVSALQGNSKMMGGMLNNPIYVGTVIWNKRRWIKDPDSAARRYVERPHSEWVTREDPTLRIISAELWHEVQDRARKGPARGMTTGKGAVAKSLLSGILMCPACRGAIVAINKERYGCSTYKDRGPAVCENKRTVLRESLDSRLIATVRKWTGFCKRWGASRFIVGNAFAYRATDVRQLAAVADPYGNEIGDHVTCIIEDADILVPCWGNTTKVPPQLQDAFDILVDVLVSSGKPVRHFGLTRAGDPKHPLMLAYNTPLLAWGTDNG